MHICVHLQHTHTRPAPGFSTNGSRVPKKSTSLEFCSLKHKSFLPLDVHNVSFTVITVKLMFLTNVYTDLISVQSISYMQILHLHLLLSAVPNRSENRQFSGGVHTTSGTFRGFHSPRRYRNNGLHINQEEKQKNVFLNLCNKPNNCTCRPIKYVLSHNINYQRVSIAFAIIVIRAAAVQQQQERPPCDTHLCTVHRVHINCRQQYSKFCWFLTTKFSLY